MVWKRLWEKERPPEIPLPPTGEIEELEKLLKDFEAFLGLPEGSLEKLLEALRNMDDWSEFRFKKSGYYLYARVDKFLTTRLTIEVGSPKGSRKYEV